MEPALADDETVDEVARREPELQPGAVIDCRPDDAVKELEEPVLPALVRHILDVLENAEVQRSLDGLDDDL